MVFSIPLLAGVMSANVEIEKQYTIVCTDLNYLRREWLIESLLR